MTHKLKTIRAVHASAAVRDWYYVKLNALLQAAYTDAVLMLTEAYNEAPPTVGIAMDAKSSTKTLDLTLKKWGLKWASRFDKLSSDMASKFAAKSFGASQSALRSALKDAGFTVAFNPTRKSLEAFRLVVADNVGLIRNLQESLYGKIQQDVWASVRAGSDMSKLADKLHKSYGIERKRAELISRDQNNKAKAIIETTRRQELGIQQAIWQHSSAAKEPRPSHVKMNGKIFDLDKGMYDEDEKEFVFPGQLINCRCTSRSVIPGVVE